MRTTTPIRWAGILGVAGALLAALVAALRATSRRKPRPFLDERGRPLAGSISEKSFVTIDGARQGMFIKSKDVSDPVLLYLHGGPGMPTYFLTERYPTGLEECW
jgi:hypothetical protein